VGPFQSATATGHACIIGGFIERLDLRDITLMVQDWGGPAGMWPPPAIADGSAALPSAIRGPGRWPRHDRRAVLQAAGQRLARRVPGHARCRGRERLHEGAASSPRSSPRPSGRWTRARTRRPSRGCRCTSCRARSSPRTNSSPAQPRDCRRSRTSRRSSSGPAGTRPSRNRTGSARMRCYFRVMGQRKSAPGSAVTVTSPAAAAACTAVAEVSRNGATPWPNVTVDTAHRPP
jgi:hypothetical protein